MTSPLFDYVMESAGGGEPYLRPSLMHHHPSLLKSLCTIDVASGHGPSASAKDTSFERSQKMMEAVGKDCLVVRGLAGFIISAGL